MATRSPELERLCTKAPSMQGLVCQTPECARLQIWGPWKSVCVHAVGWPPWPGHVLHAGSHPQILSPPHLTQSLSTLPGHCSQFLTAGRQLQECLGGTVERRVSDRSGNHSQKLMEGLGSQAAWQLVLGIGGRTESSLYNHSTPLKAALSPASLCVVSPTSPL